METSASFEARSAPSPYPTTGMNVEDERALRERSSDPLGLESCAADVRDVCRRPAGEGSGHTARMRVSEESHCGIVPMNHSNKDKDSVGGE